MLCHPFNRAMRRCIRLALRYAWNALAIQASGLAAFAANAPKSPEKPVGVVVSAEGPVFIDTHLSETSWTAAPGILLFAGYTLRNVKGSIRFSFCPNDSDFTLAPGAALTLRAQQ